MATSTIKDTTVTHGSALDYDVSIIDYSTSNWYVAPADGYVWVRTVSACEIMLPNITHTVRAIGSSITNDCLFVQKGTHVCVNGTPTHAYFRAFKLE